MSARSESIHISFTRIIRIQLMRAHHRFVSPQVFNRMFTMR